jgi:chromosome segregation ATPase
MTWIIVAISLLLGAVAAGGSLFLSKFLGGAGSSEEKVALEQKSAELDQKLSQALARGAMFASKAQFENVLRQTEEFVTSLASQKEMLKEIEQRLEQAQKDVEGKESAQQEMKSAKEEDEVRLQELLSLFDNVSNQSLTLEQELAASLKNLDTLITEVPLTADQQAVFQDLSNALTAAGSRLRDLITDYQAVNERLENLRLQHNDLEEEYTKLVEQQLGA